MQTNWVKRLPLVEFAYNDRRYPSTRLSTFELNYGCRAISPATIGIMHKVPSIVEFLTQMQQKLEMARASLSNVMARAKSYAHENRTCRKFETRDWVYLLAHSKSKVLCIGECAQISLR
ncbi:hypothetical protein O6H91_18G074200 [Diphasiastrum complanatum]|uniref:Uncharacterized protein n=1 Tax=Diphasiastrum complanatum TaxID=34168 RepID=A0ACC2B2M0_DIPCM|nr:hypothetical protein O6H91_Y244200 [Diphasiastrum complanatum]KAJ7524038.1 hypothetical protein O6H91_18G074200 [Diphasiastrum complanatum]